MRHYLSIRFDADLSAAKDEANAEMLAKEKLAREKDTLQTEFNELQEKFKVDSLVACHYHVEFSQSPNL